MGVTQSTGIQIKDGTVGIIDLSATGSPSTTTFLRGDNTWATPAGGSTLTLAAIGASPNTNGATIAAGVLTLQPADASFGGILTTGSQTIAGDKTFSGDFYPSRILSTSIIIGNPSNVAGFQFDTSNGSGFRSIFKVLNLTANRIIQLPNSAGTLVTSVNGTFADTAGNVVIAAGGGSGIVRSILLIAVATTGAAAATTDYVYICTGTFTYTQPTAMANTNLYTIKNAGTGIITILFTLAQTGDDSTSITLNPGVSLTFVSNNTNWLII